MTATVWLLIATVVLPLSYFAWSMISIDRVSGRLIQSRLTAVSSHQAGRRPGGAAPVGHARPYPDTRHLCRPAGPAPGERGTARIHAVGPSADAETAGGLGLCPRGHSSWGRSRSPQGVLLALGLTAACYFLPDLLTYNNGTKRQARIRLDLPNVLDQLLISVEAGLGFEAAVARVGASGKGPLAEEMVRTLQDIQAGRTRREAYKALAERSTVPELKSFVAAIIQADVQGLSIARVLKPQAEQMRIKRRLRAEEKAMKLPVAVVFPLLLFIFPPLFIVILGPAVLNAISTFSGR